jgi:hypothetical protein
MVASEFRSDDWTGGPTPKPATAKSRFDKWTDHHPAAVLGGGIVLLALANAVDVNGQSWAQFWWEAFGTAVALTISWGVFFAGLAASYWLLQRMNLVNHLTDVQRRYLIVLAYIALIAGAIFGKSLAIGVLHMLASFL